MAHAVKRGFGGFRGNELNIATPVCEREKQPAGIRSGSLMMMCQPPSAVVSTTIPILCVYIHLCVKGKNSKLARCETTLKHPGYHIRKIQRTCNI